MAACCVCVRRLCQTSVSDACVRPVCQTDQSAGSGSTANGSAPVGKTFCSGTTSSASGSRGAEVGAVCSNRSTMRCTCFGPHCPPFAVGTPASVRAVAIWRRDRPSACSGRMRPARSSARRRASCSRSSFNVMLRAFRNCARGIRTGRCNASWPMPCSWPGGKCRCNAGRISGCCPWPEPRRCCGECVSFGSPLVM